MSKSEWGTKRLCPSCGAKFYDLKKRPVVCPKCETKITPAEDVKKPTRPKPPPPPPPEEPKKIDPADNSAAIAEGIDLDESTEAAVKTADSNDDSLIEDASDIGEDDDDMGEVKEHMEIETPHDA